MCAYKHIIWDWNGTLLDDFEAGVATLNAMLARRNMPALDAAGYRAVFGFPVRDCYRQLGFDVSDASWEQITEEFHDGYAQSGHLIRLRPEAEPVLRALAGLGLEFSILSASEQSLLDRMLAQSGLTRYFKNVQGLDNLHGGSKLDLAHALLPRIDVPPQQILLVGDTTHDHEVARAVGCACVLLVGGHQDESRLRACGCPVIAGLQDVAACVKDHA